ncbi:MAG: gliding motility-associated C-terminal domain-containing protein [Prevotella sp.]|nr:gliding motility-associated C-terminal domain-containing protein [Prevotella sp.]
MKIKKIILLSFAALWAVFAKAQDTVESDNEVSDSTDVVFTSILTFPNGFSPNGDEFNPTFKPMAYQNIEEFHAYIFNRWGQKLYEWDDVSADGWDGTYHGKPVKQGTYFILVKARGTDGQTFNIRKDVNLLRGYSEETTVTE